MESPSMFLQMDTTYSPDTLMSSGLRVSTPPNARLVPRRLQLVPDENNPPPPANLSDTASILSPPSGWKCRRPLSEDLDVNSQDSGCAMSTCSTSDDSSNFRFAQPCGFAPKRHSSMESPRRCLTFLSENSQSSVDDGFLDLLGDGDEENAQLPSGLGSLISGKILAGDAESPVRAVERPFRRCVTDSTTPQRRRTELDEFTLKRPLKDRPLERSPQKSRVKRVKSAMTEGENGTLFAYGFWKKAAPLPANSNEVKVSSDSEIEIKLALQRSTQEELIGDFTRPFILPLVPGKHQDLKAISCDTLSQLLKGEFTDKIGSYQIIDCRYPYEYDAGHIVGAVNLYTCDHISKEFLAGKPKPNRSAASTEHKRDIVVFHCEFSSERGPFLSRFLRKEDRANNDYPALNYPEVYLLHGGYSAFFRSHPNLCDPQDYRMMQDPAHSSELKHFRAKSKSWAPGNYRKSTMRSLSRLNV